jgi:hypothetical protein
MFNISNYYIFYLVVVAFLLLLIAYVSRYKMINKEYFCEVCNMPLFTGASKCFSCDRELYQRYYNNCDTKVSQNSLSRELSSNKPNAKLGYPFM